MNLACSYPAQPAKGVVQQLLLAGCTVILPLSWTGQKADITGEPCLVPSTFALPRKGNKTNFVVVLAYIFCKILVITTSK